MLSFRPAAKSSRLRRVWESRAMKAAGGVDGQVAQLEFGGLLSAGQVLAHMAPAAATARSMPSQPKDSKVRMPKWDNSA